MNFVLKSNRKYIIYLILFVGVLAALLLRGSMLYYETGDYKIFFSKWYDFIKAHGGFKALQYSFSDYTPPYLYLLTFLTCLPIHNLYAIKMLSILFDFICAIFIALIVRLRFEDRAHWVLSFLAVLFFPTVFANSALWGQSDAIFTSGLLASVYYLLRKKYALSFLFYSLAFSFKLQSIFLFPVLLILLFRKMVSVKYILFIPMIYILMIMPSYLAGRPFKELLFIYLRQTERYSALTLNAPNLYVFFPKHYHVDIITVIGILTTLILIGLFCFWVLKSKKLIDHDMVIKLSLLSVLIVPYFLPKMHERYFFLADLFSIVFSFYFKKYFYIPMVIGFVSLFSYAPHLLGKQIIDFHLLAVLLGAAIVIVGIDLAKYLLGKQE